MRNRIVAILAAVAALLGIGFIPTAASANSVPATSTTTIVTATTTKDSSDPDTKPAPATLTSEQKQELASAGFTESYLDVYYSADHGGWVTEREFTDASHNKVTFKDSGHIGSLALSDITLASKDDRDFWCGANGLSWTIQDLVADARQQRAGVNDGSIATSTPKFGPDDVREVANNGGAWCFTRSVNS